MQSRKQLKVKKYAEEAKKNNKKVHYETNAPLKTILEEEDFMNKQNLDQEMQETKENLHFEDEFDDVYEDEDVFEEEVENSDDYESIDDDDDEGEGMMLESKGKRYIEKQKKVEKKIDAPYIGTGLELKNDEFLDFENCTYEMLHRSTTEWPCMSVDWLLPEIPMSNLYSIPRDNSIIKTLNYPIECYAIAGSMASVASKNQLYVFKFANLMKTKFDDDSEVSADEGEELDDEPCILHQALQLKSGVNRIRSMNNYPIVAIYDEMRKVQIFDVRNSLEYLKSINKDTPKYDLKPKAEPKLLKSFQSEEEGFGQDWSPFQAGRLLTGSCNGNIYQISAKDNMCADFVRDEKPYTYHEDSVEDINFSPTESEAFASCSVDGTIQIVDMRVGNKKKSQLKIEAHECDVNVISWNKKAANLIASGGDEGAFKVFDIRFPKEPAITNILWHTEPITSIEWQSGDEWSLAVGSSDNRVSIWDQSVEPDDSDVNNIKEENVNVPDQLMFVHQGQQDLKEIRWHPIYEEVLLSTAADGFNIFKPNLNEDDDLNDDEENKLEFIPDQVIAE